MPEIKHNFTGGKMNKDLDERLVPNGEYRDAMNIQVRTTSGDSDGVGDTGVVQNIQGNKKIGEVNLETPYLNISDYTNKTTLIASVGDEKNNRAYFFAASPRLEDILDSYSYINSKKQLIDTIIEVDTGTGTQPSLPSPVVVDIWAIIDTLDNTFGSVDPPTGQFTSFEVADASQYRIGMSISAISNSMNGDNQFRSTATGEPENPVILDIDTSTNIITLNSEFWVISWTSVDSMLFEDPRVLNFQNDTDDTDNTEYLE